MIFFLWGGRGVLSGGGSVPAEKTSAQTWTNMIYGFQKGSLSTRLGILMIYGIDALHGNNNVYKATIFPHNVGLGASRQAHTLHANIFVVKRNQHSVLTMNSQHLLICMSVYIYI